MNITKIEYLKAGTRWIQIYIYVKQKNETTLNNWKALWRQTKLRKHIGNCSQQEKRTITFLYFRLQNQTQK